LYLLRKRNSTKNKNKVYFVVETKGTDISRELRTAEQDKIRCAKKHFEIMAPDVIVSALCSYQRW